MVSDFAATLRRGRAFNLAWVLVPIVPALFVVIRLMPGWWPLAISQLIYVLPVLIGAIAAERAYAIGQPGIERRAWGILSITLAILVVSEGYYSWYEVFVSSAGPPSPSAFDVLNAIALLMICVAAIEIAGIGEMDRPAIWRLFFDLVAFSATTFAALYRHMAEPLKGSAYWWEPVSWAAYSLAGLLIIMAMVWLIVSSASSIERRLTSLIGVGFSIYGLGMVLSPLWQPTGPYSADPFVSALVSAFYLLGYYLVMLAALIRLNERSGPWRISHVNRPNSAGVWASTTISFWVLLGLAMMGSWLYGTKGKAADILVFLVAGGIATVALVARTAVTALETAAAKSEADLDTVTGAFSGASFLRRCDEILAHADRAGGYFSLIVFDVDDFSAMNDALGHAGGDHVLSEIARATSDVVGTRGEVFRVSADEFAIVASIDEPAASGIAAQVLNALRELHPVEDGSVSASMGVASCEARDCDRDELLRQANAAQAWAKYHGKGRVVLYDSRIVRALGVEERLRAQQDSTGLDMARALASAADARDVRNYYHSRNVAALAVMLSEALELEPERVRRIEIAAMLHDCGKLGLDDSLLAEVLRTSRQQLAAREHAAIGEMLVRSVGMLGVPEWVRHHHERWDGAGYPDGLAGDRVPLESRIIALADQYDAMTSGMRRHMPMSRGAALQEIDLGMGSRFDPMLAEKFIEIVGETVSLGWSDDWVIE